MTILKKGYPLFSVAICVYGKDNPDWFDEALKSIVEQTVKPDEIVLVVDGPIPAKIQSVINKYHQICERMTFNVIYFTENQGHGNARRAGLEACKNELVALMDADDICVGDRFEQQLKFYAEHDVDIVGGDIAEFIGTIDNVVAYRNVPITDSDIKTFMKKRCPFNQMTVMFKKNSVQKAGGYIDWYCDEDYYLWLRMAQDDCTMMNTGTILVNVRVGKDMYNRRGGKKYFQSEAKLQKYMLDNKIIGIGTYLTNVYKRFIIQVLLPNRVRGWVFKKFARKRCKDV